MCAQPTGDPCPHLRPYTTDRISLSRRAVCPRQNKEGKMRLSHRDREERGGGERKDIKGAVRHSNPIQIL